MSKWLDAFRELVARRNSSTSGASVRVSAEIQKPKARPKAGESNAVYGGLVEKYKNYGAAGSK